MWKRIPSTLLPKINKNLFRTFLSESYKCTESWNQRLTSSILQNIKADNFYYELDQKFQNHGKVSPIDIDILANKISEDGQLDALADLMHKHRMTEETTNTLDSTSHALVRAFLDQSQVQELLDILDDRLSYGIFLDSYTANLCLDTFIRSEDFKAASKIATLVMLQEDFDNKITRTLSLLACLKHIDEILPFKEEVPPPLVDEKASKKKPEEVKIRVAFIRNPYFDDHFDLKDEKLLVGKTLVMIGELMPGRIGNSAQLIGYGLRGKYEKAIALLSKIGSDVHVDAIEMLKTILEPIKDQENENLAIFHDKLVVFSGGCTDSLEKDVCNVVNAAVAESETSEIEQQKKIYTEWCELREIKLKEELERLNRIKRLENIKQLTDNMAAEEQKLWFFENEEKINLQIDSKKVFYHKRWFGKLKKPRTVDEGYVPPEIQKRRS